MRARQNLDERRLTRAIVAQKRQHLTRPDFQIDLRKRSQGTEALCDTLGDEKRSVHIGIPWFRSIRPRCSPSLKRFSKGGHNLAIQRMWQAANADRYRMSRRLCA